MDWVGWDWDGIGSPGGRGYRAPYGANNLYDNTSLISRDAKGVGVVKFHYFCANFGGKNCTRTRFYAFCQFVSFPTEGNPSQSLHKTYLQVQ